MKADKIFVSKTENSVFIRIIQDNKEFKLDIFDETEEGNEDCEAGLHHYENGAKVHSFFGRKVDVIKKLNGL